MKNMIVGFEIGFGCTLGFVVALGAFKVALKVIESQKKPAEETKED